MNRLLLGDVGTGKTAVAAVALAAAADSSSQAAVMASYLSSCSAVRSKDWAFAFTCGNYVGAYYGFYLRRGEAAN